MPRPIGMRSRGSKSLAMASQMKKAPTAIMMMFAHSTLAKPVYVKKSKSFVPMKSIVETLSSNIIVISI